MESEDNSASPGPENGTPPAPDVLPLPPRPLEPFPAPETSPPGRNWRLVMAVTVPNILALLLIGMTSWILNSAHGRSASGERSGTYILAEFVLVPLLMGLSAAFCLKGTRTGLGINVLVSFINTIIGIGLSAIVLHEGVICLIMVSPLLAGFIALGGLVGRLLFRERYRKLQLSVVPLLFLLVIADACAPHDFHTAVTDVITIHAPPERVWKYVIDYPPIQEKPDYWLWKIGLPAPVQSTATGHAVGARRRCVFQGNIAFDEKIVEATPGRVLTFDVTGQPKDPEILGHLELQRGQMRLRDNHDGTTTLIGTSWYRLKVYPAAYYNLWAEDITRRVHLRVMNQIRRLAEAPETP